LQASFDPVKFCQLEEFGCLKSLEQVALVLRLGVFVMQAIEDPAFQQLLVRDTDLDGISLRAVLFEPVGDKGDVAGSAGLACSLVERCRRPVEVDAIGCVLSKQRLLGEDRFDIIRELKGIQLVISDSIQINFLVDSFELLVLVRRHRVDD